MSISLNGDGIISGVSTLTTTPLDVVTLDATEINVGTGASVFSPTTNELALGTNGARRITITDSGFVGINTTTVSSIGDGIVPLEIKGNTTSRSGALSLNSSDNSQVAYSYLANNQFYTGTKTNHPIAFVQNDSERVRITNDASPYFRLASGTGGIQFNGDTTAANALDDYEEGTWTPATSGASTATITVYEAAYTKVGRLVTAWFSFRFSSNTDGAVASITLPFASANIGPSSNTAGSVIINYTDYSTNGITANVNNNASRFTISNTNGSNSTFSALTQAYFFGTAVYYTA